MSQDLVPLRRALDLSAARGAISPRAVRNLNRHGTAMARAQTALSWRVDAITRGGVVLLKYAILDDSSSLNDLVRTAGFDVIAAICAGISGNIDQARQRKIWNTLVTVDTMKGSRPKICCQRLQDLPSPPVTQLRCWGNTPLFDSTLGGLAYVLALMEQLQVEADVAAKAPRREPVKITFIPEIDLFGDGRDVGSGCTAADVAEVMKPMIAAGHTVNGYGVGDTFYQNYVDMGIPVNNIHRLDPSGITAAMIEGGRRGARRAITGRR
jgi:hypothetical protein